MTNQGIDIKLPKLRGEWAELRFMARAAEHGLRVTKPWGDSSDYDFAVEHHGHFLRVQVKSTKSQQGRSVASYICDIRRRRSQPYSSKLVDFFAIYVIPADVWYILPADVAIASETNLTLSPHKPDSKHAPYKEAWHLLCGKTAKRRATAGTKDCGHSESLEESPAEDRTADEPISLAEARFRAIKWNPILPAHWKPRR